VELALAEGMIAGAPGSGEMSDYQAHLAADQSWLKRAVSGWCAVFRADALTLPNDLNNLYGRSP